ncbi:hypothetical protein [Pseudonocardia oroxyli]|uniref:Uncharacterized protein n=1 Tax=Pseudonocardia oroxyli TaxID=366584 RepID=A0A1G8CFA7_PSEOR|nr:hypothetical protein [Pseudonocardia oroxyli]SDH43590.1 hypothetical protein SAMN05216377_12269 [Pseudonocardia oroxyli]
MTAYSQRGRSGTPWLIVALLALTTATSVALIGVLFCLDTRPESACPVHVQEGSP